MPSRRPSDRQYAAMVHARVAEMGRLASRLRRGRIDLDRWADDFHAVLFRGHTDAYALGRQRAGDLTPQNGDDERFGLGAADGQEEFNQNFLDQLRAGDPRYFDAEGKLREGPFKVRCRMYATRFRGTANEAFIDAGEDDDEYDWEPSARESCVGCIELASLSPHRKGAIISNPGDGQTACSVNCECRWVRRRGKLTGFSRVDVFAAGEDENGTNVSSMDTQSQSLFSNLPVVNDLPDPKDLARITRHLFGKELSGDEIAQIVGAPGGSTLTIDEDGRNLVVLARNDDLKMEMDRTFTKERGKTVAHHDYFVLDEDAPIGTGARIFARAVARYVDLPIDRIETEGAGHKGHKRYNGYYTWPRFGYNMEIPKSLRDLLEDDGFEVKDLHELFVIYGKKGRKWWREFGKGGEMAFDLAEGSVSRRRLANYLAEIGANVG